MNDVEYFDEEDNAVLMDIADLCCEIKKQDNEIERLNNIINELENFIIEKSNINNGAMQCALSSNSEIKQMGIENNIYDLIIEKLYELKENK